LFTSTQPSILFDERQENHLLFSTTPGTTPVERSWVIRGKFGQVYSGLVRIGQDWSGNGEGFFDGRKGRGTVGGAAFKRV
jgi:hypothetical protein